MPSLNVQPTRALLGLLVLAPALCVLLGCAHTKPITKLQEQASHVAPPAKVSYQMQRSLADFGAMFRAYSGFSTYNLPIIVEIDVLPNESGISKELMKDLGIFCVNVFQEIGRPFVTTRPVDGISLLETPASQQLQPRERRPKPAIRVKGVVMRNSERIVRGRELRGSATAKLEGGEGNADMGVEDRVSVRNFRVACYLEDSSGKSIPGPMAIYEVWHKSDESAANISVYFEGSGGGYNSRVQVNQDAGDAALDATAAAMIQLIGNWMQLPYWRTNPLFEEDPRLEQSLRRDLAAMPTAEMEMVAKKFMYGKGLQMDLSQPAPNASEAQLIRTEMQKVRLQPGKREAMENFIVQTWRGLDYRSAADRIECLGALAARTKREQQLVASARSQPTPAPVGELPAKETMPPPPPGPLALQGKEGRVVRVDLSRLLPPARIQFLEKLKAMPVVLEVQSAPNGEVCMLRHSGEAESLQASLRRSPDLAEMDYVWADFKWDALAVVLI